MAADGCGQRSSLLLCHNHGALDPCRPGAWISRWPRAQCLSWALGPSVDQVCKLEPLRGIGSPGAQPTRLSLRVHVWTSACRVPISPAASAGALGWRGCVPSLRIPPCENTRVIPGPERLIPGCRPPEGSHPCSPAAREGQNRRPLGAQRATGQALRQAGAWWLGGEQGRAQGVQGAEKRGARLGCRSWTRPDCFRWVWVNRLKGQLAKTVGQTVPGVEDTSWQLQGDKGHSQEETE